MKIMKLTALAAMAALLGGFSGGDPINETCPISGRAVNTEATTQIDGHTVAACCNGCVSKINAMDASGKQAILAKYVQPDDGRSFTGDPYTLNACPLSGNPVSVSKKIEGREVRFCCGGCAGRFEASPDWAKVDEMIAKDQKKFFPMTTCVVSDEKLDDESAINVVYRNRLVRLCCKGCIRGFEKSPEATIAKIDKATIARQGPHYPMKTCLVGGHDLGEDAIERVYANRLVRFCCEGCIEKFEKNAPTFVATLDKAWEAKKNGN